VTYLSKPKQIIPSMTKLVEHVKIYSAESLITEVVDEEVHWQVVGKSMEKKNKEV
jgi:hypothetical protein